MNRWTQGPTNPKKIVLTVNQKETVATCTTAGAAALIIHRLANYGPMVEALKVLVLTPGILAHLEAHDPKALEQAKDALRQAGEI